MNNNRKRVNNSVMTSKTGRTAHRRIRGLYIQTKKKFKRENFDAEGVFHQG